jgi:hypothetical protein
LMFISVPVLLMLGVYSVPVILGLYIIISVFTFYKLKS